MGRIPTDREELLALHKEHGSWSAVARKLGISRSKLGWGLSRIGLVASPKVNHDVAHRRLSQQQQWIINREELRLRLEKHGSINAVSVAESIGGDTVKAWVGKHNLTPDEWVQDPANFGVRRFEKPLVLSGDWAIASDFQAPFTDCNMVKLLCKIGQAWGIKNLLIPGDFLDLQHFSKHDPLREDEPTWDDTKRFCKTLLRTLSEAFPGEKVWSAGNHELRITKLTKGRFTIKELAAAVEATDWKIVQSPLVQIQTPRGIWDIIHPGSYSIIPTAVGKDFAHKTRHHVMVAHGHSVGYRRDYSGESECLDIGGMFDPQALVYTHLFPKRYPVMLQGFALLVKGHAYPLQPDSDVNFWVKAGEATRGLRS